MTKFMKIKTIVNSRFVALTCNKVPIFNETSPTKLVSINKKRKSDAQLSNEKVMHKCAQKIAMAY